MPQKVEPEAPARHPGRPAPARLLPAPRGGLGLIAALAAAVVLALGIRYAGVGAPGSVDARVGEALDGPGPLWWDLASVLDALGEPVGATVLVAAVLTGCLLLRRPRAAVFTVVAVGLAVGLTTVLKHVVGRTIHGGYLSYPSGHTAFATALALVVTLLATHRRGRDGPGPGPGRTAGLLLLLAAALVAGAAMGWAQVVMGAHYPTDTLGGFCTALAVVPATGWLVDRTADAARRERR
ncbi:phosphatase PAP2 family protein [Kitasatospora sp. NPDC093806]|uniref:phosphatase PAP2 family protein n=1 Tax=Kitasatospora sp. NPDC093806 TaxID=3155075 RepID=UPI00341D0404